MTDPFDDPEVRAQMQRLGIVHQPGLAAQMLQELSPLLAAEGIDLDDINVDADGFQAALDRATEQHNLMLSTPVGAQRAGALALLRVYATAIDAGDVDRAAPLLEAIQPEPDGDRPAISHVIGVSLATLDEWSRDPASRSALQKARVPAAPRAVRDAAKDVLALAGKGRAFDSLGPLTLRHGGLALFRGGCLAVAASVAARAKREGTTVARIAERVLPGGTAPAAGSGAAFGVPAAAPGSAFPKPHAAGRDELSAKRDALGAKRDASLVRDFRAWLRDDPAVTSAGAAGEAAFLERLLATGRQQGDDFDDPDTVVDMYFSILDAGDAVNAEARAAALELLHDYVHFRIDTDDHPGPWSRADLEIGIDDEFDDEPDEPAHPFDLIDADIPAALAEAASTAGDRSIGDRLAAIGRMRLVTAVDELLEWVGTGRSVTGTGGLRRADIEPVAAMLGIAAVGAAKRSTLADREAGGPLRVTSLWELPLLSAWWAALRDAGLLSLTATRARPGPSVAVWRASDGHASAHSADAPGAAASLDLRQNLVAMAFAHRLADSRWGGFEHEVAAEVIRRVLPAIAPRAAADVDATEAPDYLHSAIIAPRVTRILDDLQTMGMLELDERGGVAVDPALREAIARGIVLFARLVDEFEDDQFD